MRSVIVALAVGLAMAACGGEGMGLPEECPKTALEPSQNPVRECLYKLPAGEPCDGFRVYVDDVEIGPESYNLVCGAGQLSVPACGDSVVAVTTGC